MPGGRKRVHDAEEDDEDEMMRLLDEQQVMDEMMRLLEMES